MALSKDVHNAACAFRKHGGRILFLVLNFIFNRLDKLGFTVRFQLGPVSVRKGWEMINSKSRVQL